MKNEPHRYERRRRCPEPTADTPIPSWGPIGSSGRPNVARPKTTTGRGIGRRRMGTPPPWLAAPERTTCRAEFGPGYGCCGRNGFCRHGGRHGPRAGAALRTFRKFDRDVALKDTLHRGMTDAGRAFRPRVRRSPHSLCRAFPGHSRAGSTGLGTLARTAPPFIWPSIPLLKSYVGPEHDTGRRV